MTHLNTLPTEEQLLQAKAFEGTCASIPAIAEALGIADDDADEIMSQANLETCSDCGWWVESGELSDEDGEIVACSSCRM